MVISLLIHSHPCADTDFISRHRTGWHCHPPDHNNRMTVNDGDTVHQSISQSRVTGYLNQISSRSQVTQSSMVLITYGPPLMSSRPIDSRTKWNFKNLVQGMNILSNFDVI